MTGVVFNTRAHTKFTQCFYIITRTLFQSLLLQQLTLIFQYLKAIRQLLFNRIRCPIDDFLLCRITTCRVYHINGIGIQNLAAQRIHFTDSFNFIIKHFDAKNKGIRMTRCNLDHITADTKGSPQHIHVVSRILSCDQLSHQLLAIDDVSYTDREKHLPILLRIAGTVNTCDRGYDNRIPSFQNGIDSGHTQHIQLHIGCRILINIGIRAWNIRLRLIIIKVGYKVFHPVVGKEFLKL